MSNETVERHLTMRDERFGRLLRAAIGSIVTHEGTTAPLVETELGHQIGLSPASIQRYKAGHIPPDPRTVALFAAAGVQRGFLNAVWLRTFLRAARYYDSATLLAHLCPEAVPELPSPPVMPAAPSHNLPAPTYLQFVPRAATVDVFDGLRQRTAVVLITGLGGMGKTSLAREVAAACLLGAPELPAFEAVVWVSDQDQPGITTLDTVLATIARTLDYPGLLQLDHASRRHAVEQLLRRERVLLVVDQCETITDTALFAWLLRLPEPSKALLTSRVERAELRQGSWNVTVGGLTPNETAMFLTQQVGALKLESRVRDLSQLDDLCAATGGNPKALSLALGALRYGQGTLQQVIDDLATAQGDVFDAVFTRSWALLHDDARHMLRVASLFHGSICLDALAASAGLDTAAAARALAQLTASALLDVQQTDLECPPRYTLHPLVRAFAAGQLAAQPDLAHQARTRQLSWYADLAATVGYCWDDLARLTVLDAEQETLTALIRWGVAEKAPDLARLVRGVDYYYYIRGLWALLPDLAAVRVATAREAGDLVEATRALAYQLQMRCRQNQLTDVEARLNELVQLRDLPEMPPDVRFEVMYTLGLYWTTCEHYSQAISCWQQALPLACELSVRAYAVNRGWLAICYYRQGAGEQAEALWKAVLNDAATGGFARGVVSSQVGLARIALDRGDTTAAHVLLVAAQEGARAYSDRSIVAEIQTLLARYYWLRGEEGATRDVLAAAHDTFARLGMVKEQAAVNRMLLTAQSPLMS